MVRLNWRAGSLWRRIVYGNKKIAWRAYPDREERRHVLASRPLSEREILRARLSMSRAAPAERRMGGVVRDLGQDRERRLIGDTRGEPGAISSCLRDRLPPGELQSARRRLEAAQTHDVSLA
jgi:hypothetical protein